MRVVYKGAEDAFVGLEPVRTVEPNKQLKKTYQNAYETWEAVLNKQL